MDGCNSEEFSTTHIGHLGLVADKIAELDLIELIDQRLPVSEAHGAKVFHGERVSAMIYSWRFSFCLLNYSGAAYRATLLRNVATIF